MVPVTSHSLLGAFSIYSKCSEHDFSSSGLWAFEAPSGSGFCQFFAKVQLPASSSFFGEDLVHWKYGFSGYAPTQSKLPKWWLFAAYGWVVWVQSLGLWITQKRQAKYSSAQCQAMIILSLFHYLYDKRVLVLLWRLWHFLRRHLFWGRMLRRKRYSDIDPEDLKPFWFRSSPETRQVFWNKIKDWHGLTTYCCSQVNKLSWSSAIPETIPMAHHGSLATGSVEGWCRGALRWTDELHP